ncbi:MAG: nitroreductase family protein [Candidatus Omnitrophica bacterium]|nr:nitroreductase family protein [Candidatus Omnitrophota bacterium]
MNKKTFALLFFLLTIFVINSTIVFADSIQLPKPEMQKGKPLMQALKERKTTRSFSAKDISLQELSNLLWAACGVNRPDSGKRTVPSAHNWQPIDVYVARPDGLYFYDAHKNLLKQVLKEDLRETLVVQDFTQIAPIDLIYVADYTKMKKGTEEQKQFYAAADTGFISQNVYLYCASEGYATVVRGGVDKPALEKKMKLPVDKKVVLVQPVGYPEK